MPNELCEYDVFHEGMQIHTCRFYFGKGEKCNKGFDYAGKINFEDTSWRSLCPVDGMIPLGIQSDDSL